MLQMLQVLALLQCDIFALRFDWFLAYLHKHHVLKADPLGACCHSINMCTHDLSIHQFEVLYLPKLEHIEALTHLLLVHLYPFHFHWVQRPCCLGFICAARILETHSEGRGGFCWQVNRSCSFAFLAMWMLLQMPPCSWKSGVTSAYRTSLYHWQPNSALPRSQESSWSPNSTSALWALSTWNRSVSAPDIWSLIVLSQAHFTLAPHSLYPLHLSIRLPCSNS